MASRFSRLRERFGLRQEELARLLDIRREEVSRIENAKVYPFPTTLRRFSALEARGDGAKHEIEKLRSQRAA